MIDVLVNMTLGKTLLQQSQGGALIYVKPLHRWAWVLMCDPHCMSLSCGFARSILYRKGIIPVERGTSADVRRKL
jgi:hypothetical protein